MSNFVIVTESNTDLSDKLVKQMGIELLQMKVVIDGKTYDNCELEPKGVYKMLKDGTVITTVQMNSAEFEDAFKPILEDGKDILYIGFSSGLSGTFFSAQRTKLELQPKYADRKIMVFDSLSASMGQGLMVYYASKLQKEGKSIDEIYEWLVENQLKLAHWFTVDDLMFLKRGGRVSGASAVIGTMLGIKPILHVDNSGRLVPSSKVRGRKPSLDALAKKYQETAINPKEQVVYISHADCFEDAKYLAGEIKKIGCKEVEIGYIGAVIGSHSGPGTVALFFLGNER